MTIFVNPQGKKYILKDTKPIWIIYERRLLLSFSGKIIFLMYFLSKSKFRSKKHIKLLEREEITAIRNCPELLLIVPYIVYSQNMRTTCRRLHICLVKCNRKSLFSFYIVSFYSCCSFRTQTRWSHLIKSADSSSTTWPLTPSGLVKEWPGERPRPGEKSSLSSMPSKHQKVLIWSKNVIPSLTVTSHMLSYIYPLLQLLFDIL